MNTNTNSNSYVKNSPIKEILFYNPSEEFKAIYFDKLNIMAVDKCLRLIKEHKLNLDDTHLNEFFDLRNKHVEACFDKFFALHQIFDEEFFSMNDS